MSLEAPRKATTAEFALSGAVAPLVGPLGTLRKAADGYEPRRALGGWLATYGRIGPSGGVLPTEDREGHVFEAAGAIGRIDFKEYLSKGIWNDTHGPVNVGVPTLLEHHGSSTELAKAHGKVGWWTEGHLFDRNDPRSWLDFTAYVPTARDLDRADHFWRLATLMKGLPRDLGFSAEGRMMLSPCRKRIVWAAVNKMAVCELPQNPDATAIPLRLAVPVTEAMVGAEPCSTCTCPPNARCTVVPLAAAVTTATIAPGVPEDLEGGDDNGDEVENLVRKVQKRLGCSRLEARRRVSKWAREVIRNRRKGDRDGEPGTG